MYYEERVIEGVLHFRSDPYEEWRVKSPISMTNEILKLRDELTRTRQLLEEDVAPFLAK